MEQFVTLWLAVAGHETGLLFTTSQLGKRLLSFWFRCITQLFCFLFFICNNILKPTISCTLFQEHYALFKAVLQQEHMFDLNLFLLWACPLKHNKIGTEGKECNLFAYTRPYFFSSRQRKYWSSVSQMPCPFTTSRKSLLWLSQGNGRLGCLFSMLTVTILSSSLPCLLGSSLRAPSTSNSKEINRLAVDSVWQSMYLLGQTIFSGTTWVGKEFYSRQDTQTHRHTDMDGWES